MKNLQIIHSFLWPFANLHEHFFQSSDRHSKTSNTILLHFIYRLNITKKNNKQFKETISKSLNAPLELLDLSYKIQS